MTGSTKGLLCVETFVSLEEAHDEGHFQWASGWPHESPPACVWRRIDEGGLHGTTGLPGSIETTEANAERLAACWNALIGLNPAAVASLIEAAEGIRAWAASLTVCDMNEIVADNGITAGMVVGQEAGEQVRRMDRALTALRGAQ